LTSIEAPDEHTVVFKLKRPYSPLLQRLDVVEASIIPRHKYEGQDLLNGEATRRPVGTGPFRFVSYAPGNNVVLERNADYFRKGFPGVDRLVFRIIPNPSMSIAALEKGEIDYVGGVPGPDAERLRKAPGIAVVAGTGGPGGSICQDVLIPNITQQPFSDRRVRRAFAHAIDRGFIVDRVYFGQGTAATGPVSHLLTWAYTPETQQYTPDQELARRLLDEAGWKPGKQGERFAITFTHAANQQRLAQALRQQLSEVGITLNLQAMDFNAAVEQVFVKKTFDLGFASFCNGADPDIGVRRVYVSSNIGPFPFSNGAGYRNARVDQLFDLGSEAADRDGRRRYYVEIQQILAEDVPYFWLIDSEGLRAHRTAFTGFRLWTGAFVEGVRPTPAAGS
jgi:peptide/nickel transport system substrate-binding protein